MATIVLAAGSAQASLDIPNGSTIGVTSTINVSGLSGPITSLSLNLNISGGNNGDLYAYLAYDGNVVTLLNRPGTSSNPLGFTDAGYNVLVEDGGVDGDLNAATGGSPVTGTYYADGDSTAFSTAFGSDPNDGNGTWTLFIADLSGGGTGSDSQLNYWLLTINGATVPEPITWSLIIFGGGLALLYMCNVWRTRETKIPKVANKIF